MTTETLALLAMPIAGLALGAVVYWIARRDADRDAKHRAAE